MFLLCTIFLLPVFVYSKNCSLCACENTAVTCENIKEHTLENIISTFNNESVTNLTIKNVAFGSTLKDKMFNDGNIQVLELKILEISNSNIISVQQNTFYGLVNLSTLILSYNKITSIKKDTFHTIQNVGHIQLEYNEISELPTDIFDSLLSLYTLNISSNILLYLNENIFKNNKYLKSIDLSNNQLKYLSEKLFITNMYLKELCIYIEKNPWNCTCELWLFYDFIKNRNNQNLNEIYCNTKPWNILNKNDFICEPTITMNINKTEKEIILSCNIISNPIESATDFFEIIKGVEKEIPKSRKRTYQNYNVLEHILEIKINDTIYDYSCYTTKNNTKYYKNITRYEIVQQTTEIVTAKEDETLIIKCNHSNVKWYFNSFGITNDVIQNSNGKYEILNNELTIRNITIQNQGIYTCSNLLNENMFQVFISESAPTLLIILIVIFIILLLITIGTIYYFKHKSKNQDINMSKDIMVESNIYMSSEDNIYEDIK